MHRLPSASATGIGSVANPALLSRHLHYLDLGVYSRASLYSAPHVADPPLPMVVVHPTQRKPRDEWLLCTACELFTDGIVRFAFDSTAVRLPGGRLCLLEPAGALPRPGCDQELPGLPRHGARQVLRHHGRDNIPDPSCGRRYHSFHAEQSVSGQLGADRVDDRPEPAARLIPVVHNRPDPLWYQSVGSRLYRLLCA